MSKRQARGANRKPKGNSNAVAQLSASIKRLSTKESALASTVTRLAKRSAPSVARHVLPSHAQHILHSMVHPHSAAHGQVRGINAPAEPTQAVTAKAGGTLTMNSTGVAWLAFCPIHGSDRDVMQYTDVNYTGSSTIVTRPNVATTGISGVSLAVPYTNATLKSASAFNTYRLNSLGLELSYSGVDQNAAGDVYAYVDPKNRSIAGLFLTDVINRDATKHYRINNRDCCHMVATPQRRDSLEMGDLRSNQFTLGFPQSEAATLSNWDYTSAAASSSGPACAVMFITAPAGAVFTWNLVGHFEFGGQAPACTVQNNTVDEVSYSHIQDVVATIHASHAANPGSHPMDHVSDALVSKGISLAQGPLKNLQKSQNPLVATSAYIASQGLKAGSGPLKKMVRKGLGRFKL